MRQTLEEKVVWITGASSGIGRALAVEAARRGARLLLSGRNEAALRETAERCGAASAHETGSSKGGTVSAQRASRTKFEHASSHETGSARPECVILPFDLADLSACAAAARRAEAIFGRIDVLALNAGVSQRAKFAETAPEVFDAIVRTNFSASVALTRAILPGMRARDSGTIVAISSVAGLMGAPWRTEYSASKHALAGFFGSLRAELHGSGIQISMVYPGFVRTAISENAFAGDGSKHGELDPLQQAGQDPAETARLVWNSVGAGALEIKVAFDFKARLGVFLSRHVPGLFVRSISRHGGL